MYWRSHGTLTWSSGKEETFLLTERRRLGLAWSEAWIEFQNPRGIRVQLLNKDTGPRGGEGGLDWGRAVELRPWTKFQDIGEETKINRLSRIHDLV